MAGINWKELSFHWLGVLPEVAVVVEWRDVAPCRLGTQRESMHRMRKEGPLGLLCLVAEAMQDSA